MARTSWKHRERQAASMIGGTRYPANMGATVDVESAGFVGQVKERKTLSLAALEALVIEMDRVAAQKSPPKIGVVLVKRSAGKGRATPWLLVLSEAGFRALNGALPGEEASES